MTTDGNLANVIPLSTPLTAPATFITFGDDVDVVELLGLTGKVEPFVFGNDEWDFTGHAEFKNNTPPGERVCDFTSVPFHKRPLVKMWVLLQADAQVVADKLDLDTLAATLTFNKKAKPRTLTATARVAGLVLSRFADAHLDRLEPEHWAQATAEIQKAADINSAGVTHLAPATSRQRVAVLKELHTTGGLLGWPDPFGSEPWNGDSRDQVIPRTGSESSGLNVTEPTMDAIEVYGVAAFLTSEIAENLLAIAAWWTDRHRTVTPPQTNAEARQMLVDAYTAQGREHGAVAGAMSDSQGLCTAHGAMIYTLGNHNLNRNTLNHMSRDALEIASGRLMEEGVIESVLQPRLGVSPCPIPVKTFKSDSGEMVPFATNLLWEQEGSKRWLSALVHAVAVTIQFLSVARDGDRVLLEKGCATRETVTMDDGIEEPQFWMERWKQKNVKTPFRTTRIALSRHEYEAIQHLEQLHTILGIDARVHPHDKNARLLFDSNLNIGAPNKTNDAVHLDGAWLSWLKTAAKQLHEAGVIPRAVDHVGGLTSREIRATGMILKADRPLGHLVAAREGDHESYQTFLGYTGSVAQQWGFADEDAGAVTALKRAVQSNRLRHVTELSDTAVGNGAPIFAEHMNSNPQVFDAVKDFGDPANPGVLTDKQIKKLGPFAENLVTGPFSHCLGDMDKALCGSKGEPDWTACRPAKCENSVMTPGQLAAVELRRRFDVEHRALANSVDLIDDELTVLLEPYAEMSDSELRKITDDENTAYVEITFGRKDNQ